MFPSAIAVGGSISWHVVPCSRPGCSPRYGSGGAGTAGAGSSIRGRVAGQNPDRQPSGDGVRARMLDVSFLIVLAGWSAGVGFWVVRRFGPPPEAPTDALALAVA